MSESAGVRVVRDLDGFARVVFDAPGEKVNTLREAVLLAFRDDLDRIAADRGIRGVVIESGKSGNFLAGADVGEIHALRTAEEVTAKARLGQEIFRRLAALPVPTAAAIHGACLGGGTELALACTYRLASDDPSTRIGLPEVRLGILPGFGGTQRLPRVVGLRAALDLLLTGREMSAAQARRIGLVDEVAPAEILVAAAKARIARRPPPRRAGGAVEWILRRIPPVRLALLGLARRRLRRTLAGDYPAPFRILEVLHRTSGLPLDEGLEVEAGAVGALAVTPTARHLMTLFDLQARARRDPGVPPGGRPRPVGRAAVVGAGIMGAGIALEFAARGTPVRLRDVALDPIARGLAEADRILVRDVRRGRRTAREARAQFGRIQPTLEWSGFRGVDFVVEAVFEDLELKRRVLREIEGAVGPECVIATNTSSIPIREIRQVAEHPGRFLGLHFFNPVHRMTLVEVIAAEGVEPWAVATAVELVKEFRKIPIVVRDGPGFLVNRLLMAYLGEAIQMAEEGADAAAIDRALREFGMPAGPFRLLDQVGLDVACRAAETLHRAFGRGGSAVDLLQRFTGAGRLGVKNGRGFYLYRNGRPAGDPAAAGLIRPRGRTRPGADEIRRRTLLPMVNEAARCLEEGVVGRPGDVDLALILGTGFPPFRGGLLRWADGIGIDGVVADLEGLAAVHGDRLIPAGLLREMARRGRQFFG